MPEPDGRASLLPDDLLVSGLTLLILLVTTLVAGAALGYALVSSVL
jgi:hypothetical protein